MSKPKTPTIQQLVDIIREYNVARGQELSQKPPGGWPMDYQNPMMEALYDAAQLAARTLAMLQVTEVSLAVPKRDGLKINLQS